MSGLQSKYSNYYMQINSSHGPYKKEEIPSLKIDYRGLMAYAKGKGRRVVDLTDDEKEMFTNGISMNEIRVRMLHE